MFVIVTHHPSSPGAREGGGVIFPTVLFFRKSGLKVSGVRCANIEQSGIISFAVLKIRDQLLFEDHLRGCTFASAGKSTTVKPKYVRIFGNSDGTGTYFRGPYLLSGGMIRRSEKYCKEGVCSIQCFP